MLLTIDNVYHYHSVIRNARFNLPILVYILTNTFRNFTANHLVLNEIDLLEVVILLFTYLIMCVPNKIENLNLSVLNMITGVNELKTLRKHISCKCKCKFNRKKM